MHTDAWCLRAAEVAAGSELGVRAKEFMEAGALVPDDVIIGMVLNKLADEDCVKNGWLLDGFPRSLAQAERLASEGVQPHAFLLLDVPDEVCINRIAGRRVDPVTANTYHVSYNPPPTDVAERCIQRSDDTEEKMASRLQVFHENVDAIQSMYAGVMLKVDGTQESADVFEQLCGAVDAAIQPNSQQVPVSAVADHTRAEGSAEAPRLLIAGPPTLSDIPFC